MCGLNFPFLAQFAVCPIHGEPTKVYEEAEPSENWMPRFEALKKRAEEDGLVIERAYPLAHEVAVIEEGEQLFLDQRDLQRAGTRLSRMKDDQFYLIELDDGWVYETQGFDFPNRRWWVERVAEVSDA